MGLNVEQAQEQSSSVATKEYIVDITGDAKNSTWFLLVSLTAIEAI